MRTRMFAVCLVFCAGATFAATMSVQVRNGKVRNRPSQLGRVVDSVPYGEAVEAGELKRGWYPVTLANGKQGWLHQSALSAKAVKMSAGTTDVATGVSNDEVALAAKGFNEQVEAELKQKTALDYTWVDRMAAFQVDEDQIRVFLAEGHLTGGDL